MKLATLLQKVRPHSIKLYIFHSHFILFTGCLFICNHYFMSIRKLINLIKNKKINHKTKQKMLIALLILIHDECY